MKKERKRKKAKKSAEQPIVKVETGETLAEEICALQLFSEELGGKWRGALVAVAQTVVAWLIAALVYLLASVVF